MSEVLFDIERFFYGLAVTLAYFRILGFLFRQEWPETWYEKSSIVCSYVGGSLLLLAFIFRVAGK